MSEQDKTRILIVEDSEDDALLLQAELRRVARQPEFLRVDTAEAMAGALQETRWDIVISDHSMPRFDSARALEVLKASGRDIPFIIYSGCFDHGRGVSAMRGGAQDFVDKNDLPHMLAVVERELRNARLRRDKETAERSVLELARYDSLTRLPNRSLLSEMIQLKLGDRGGEMAALLYLDLDRFMRINESLGYAAGDSLIRQVASRLRAAVPSGGLVSRLGQDEFAVFLSPCGGEAEARALAGRLLRRFAEPFLHSGQELFLTLSAGLAICPGHGTDPATLLKNAESAMFTAKRLGGNRCQSFRAELNVASTEALRLESDLRHAVQRGQLFLAFQPLIDLASGQIIAAEALLRWRHPDCGLIPPDRFIPIADETGQIVPIGEWALATACSQARAWRERGHPGIGIAVNFTATQFRQERVADRVVRVLRHCGLPPSALELEITESTAMQDAESTIETLTRLKSMGVRLAIDDFGTGYSSLSYLKRFPIDTLKIDKSFVRDLPQDAENVAIARTVIGLGRTMRLAVLAEGIENEAQRDFLRAEGCDRGQGYWFARPLPGEAFVALLDEWQGRPARVFSLPALAAEVALQRMPAAR